MLQILQDLDTVAAMVDYMFSRNTLLVYALCISKWSAMKITQRWERGVYGMVSKINYKSIQLPLFLVMANACALGPWRCLPGPIFCPRNFNIKIGPGDKAISGGITVGWLSSDYCNHLLFKIIMFIYFQEHCSLICLHRY